MKRSRITTFYRPEQSYQTTAADESRSPAKPRLLAEYLERHGLWSEYFEVAGFEPFDPEVFRLAHTDAYVDGFFAGQPPYADSHGILGIKWTPAFAQSVRYTNASLYHAIRHAIEHPDAVTFSPTSGFHHAIPKCGALFCAFSGQVIASVRLYRELGVSGAWIDLDGHHGNSIEDSRSFVPDLDAAVPPGFNVNLKSMHQEYLDNLRILLRLVGEEILAGRLHYVVFCHGADSHEDDDLGCQLTTAQWLACSDIFYRWVEEIEAERGAPRTSDIEPRDRARRTRRSAHRRASPTGSWRRRVGFVRGGRGVCGRSYPSANGQGVGSRVSDGGRGVCGRSYPSANGQGVGSGLSAWGVAGSSGHRTRR